MAVQQLTQLETLRRELLELADVLRPSKAHHQEAIDRWTEDVLRRLESISKWYFGERRAAFFTGIERAFRVFDREWMSGTMKDDEQPDAFEYSRHIKSGADFAYEKFVSQDYEGYDRQLRVIGLMLVHALEWAATERDRRDEEHQTSQEKTRTQSM